MVKRTKVTIHAIDGVVRVTGLPPKFKRRYVADSILPSGRKKAKGRVNTSGQRRSLGSA
jgi:hypothetical protein